MPRLPLDLGGAVNFRTPQNSPVVVLPLSEPGPQQLPIQGIEPEYSQFQRTRKVQLTGRGQNIGIHYVNAPSFAGIVHIYCSIPIPFRALLRMLFYWTATKSGTWFIPFVTNTDLTGVYTTTTMPNFQKVVQGYFAAAIPNGALVEYAFMGQQVCPLNYLCAKMGARVGVAMGDDAQSNYFSHYVFEALEVADDK